MHVALVDLRADAIDAAVGELAQICPEAKVVGIACDVSQTDEMRRCVAAVQLNFPKQRVGAVFANAGVFFQGVLEKQPIEEWSMTSQVNVIGVVNTIQAFLPALQASSEPSILATTSSIAGLMIGDGATAAYGASKHAVVALTEALSFELARKHPQIRVHVLLPCQVRSSLYRTSASSRVDLIRAAGGSEEALRKAKQVEGVVNDAFQKASIESESLTFFISPENHAAEVFTAISRAEFYVLGENVRPYADHDFPFGAFERLQERHDGIMRLQLDNRDALEPNTQHGPVGQPRSRVLKGPMYREMRRLGNEKLKAKL